MKQSDTAREIELLETKKFLGISKFPSQISVSLIEIKTFLPGSIFFIRLRYSLKSIS